MSAAKSWATTPLKSPLLLEEEQLLLALSNLRQKGKGEISQEKILAGIEEKLITLPEPVLGAFLDALIQESLSWKEESVTLLRAALYDALPPQTFALRQTLAENLGKLLAFHERDFAKEVRLYLSPENLLYSAEALEESFASFVRAYIQHRKATRMSEEDARDLLHFLETLSPRLWIDLCFSLPAQEWTLALREEALQHAMEIDSIASLALQAHLAGDASLSENHLGYLTAPEDYLRGYAKGKVLEAYGEAVDWEEIFQRIPKNSTLYLSNLLSSTPPAAKIYTMQMLMHKSSLDEKKSYDLLVHLMSVLRSEQDPLVLRSCAQMLLDLSTSLTEPQRRELIDELSRSIAKDSYQSADLLHVLSFYIKLEGEENYPQWESVLSEGIKSTQENRSLHLLRVVYELLCFSSAPSEHEDVLIHLLLSGMAHFREKTATLGLWCFTQLLKDPQLSPQKKHRLLGLLLLKTYSILRSDQHHTLLYKTMRRYFLESLFTLLSEEELDNFFSINRYDRIAFFPGSFDPFSLGHKAIAMEVAARGYEVYLAIDEFSWSKSTSPNLVRREILSLSIADEFHLHIFPREFSVNIASPADLAELREIFSGREVTLLMGGDVILGASAYRSTPSDSSVHSFPHILFTRADSQAVQKRAAELALKVQLVDLGKFSRVSSTKIREGIGLQQDITGLVDPMAKEYIYERDLYAADERVKHALHVQPRHVVIEEIDGNHTLHLSIGEDPCGSVSFRRLTEKDELSQFLGADPERIVLIHALDAKRQENRRLLLQELLRHVLTKDFSLAVTSGCGEELLADFGFLPLEHSDSHYYVDLSEPCTLSLDVSELILEPFSNAHRVRQALDSSRQSLRRAIRAIFPGHLLMSVSQEDIYSTLIPMITAENGVPLQPLKPRILGEALCVPFGEIFKKRILPNTVTKSIHTEKFFEEDVKKWSVEHFPGYLPLEEQVRMLRSFERAILLVDDLLHKGYRIRRLYPVLQENGLHPQKLFVGILSGRGKEIARTMNLPVEAAYYVDNLRFWFQESKLYPYIGGDSVLRDIPAPKSGFLPSMNLLYPYTRVVFMHAHSPDTMMAFSQTCLEASLEVLLALEEEYRERKERLLTMDRLGEVLRYTRFPVGTQEEVQRKSRPSELLRRDIRLLKRLRGVGNDD